VKQLRVFSQQLLLEVWNNRLIMGGNWCEELQRAMDIASLKEILTSAGRLVKVGPVKNTLPMCSPAVPAVVVKAYMAIVIGRRRISVPPKPLFIIYCIAGMLIKARLTLFLTRPQLLSRLPLLT
jgi:hypothetical protein